MTDREISGLGPADRGVARGAGSTGAAADVRGALARAVDRLPRRRHGATVLLELAHSQPAVHTALLGSTAESTAALLLHAQHLRACEVEVAAWIGPLLPALADDRMLESMMRHIVAADLLDVHAVSADSRRALRCAVRRAAVADVATMARAFGVDPGDARDLPTQACTCPARQPRAAPRRPSASPGSRRPTPRRCGCAAQCQLDPEQRPAFVSVRTCELFPDESA